MSLDAHRVMLTITGLNGPEGRLSRADIGIQVRRKLDFPTAGAWFGGLPVHGPYAVTRAFGRSISPYAVGELREVTRGRLAWLVRNGLESGDTGVVHGPNPR